MPKFYDKRTLNHQQAVMWVGSQVFAMKNVFNPQQTEAGIDGIIELADPQTGSAAACFVGVQVKTAMEFDAESETQFSFYADGRDLEYWNSSQIPVLLVVCRAGTEEAYAVLIQDYFKRPEARNTKTVIMLKEQDRFRGTDEWSRRLLGIAVPRTRGLSFPPVPKEEPLSSNLLEVILPKTLYYGVPKLKTRPEIAVELAKQNAYAHEFIVRDGMVWTVHSLYENVWSTVIDNGTIKLMDFRELAFHADRAKRRYAVELMNLCLSSRLRREDVIWFKEEEMYVYAPQRIPTKRVRKKVQTDEAETRRGLIFPSYYQGRLVRCRHLAMMANFTEIEGSYYLQVDPTYFFSRDGKQKHRKWEDLIRAARILQKEQDYYNNLEVWREVLTVKEDFARQDYPFLRFKDYLRFTCPVSVPDDVWKPKSKREQGDLDQKLLALMQ